MRVGWDQPYADEIRYTVQHPGPDREFAVWAKEKKIRWIGVNCGSADHPMNTIIRDWMPRQTAEADKVFQEMYGTTKSGVPGRCFEQAPFMPGVGGYSPIRSTNSDRSS